MYTRENFLKETGLQELFDVTIQSRDSFIDALFEKKM
jgi:hypothetical protein